MDADTTSSSASVRLQAVVPLTPAPFAVSAAAAEDTLRVVPAAAAATAATRHAATPVVLCAATPTRAPLGAASQQQQQQWVLATVQSNGVYLYNTNNQHCLLSFSIPPAVRLACPACFIPSNDLAD
ncbi:hypothetical protein HK405_014616, partial [Cladochytrium tenue]